MSKTEKVQLLYYFTEYCMENGMDVERKKNCLKTIEEFIEEWKDNYNSEYFERDDLPMFAESLEKLNMADSYLKKIMEV